MYIVCMYNVLFVHVRTYVVLVSITHVLNACTYNYGIIVYILLTYIVCMYILYTFYCIYYIYISIYILYVVFTCCKDSYCCCYEIYYDQLKIPHY